MSKCQAPSPIIYELIRKGKPPKGHPHGADPVFDRWEEEKGESNE